MKTILKRKFPIRQKLYRNNKKGVLSNIKRCDIIKQKKWTNIGADIYEKTKRTVIAILMVCVLGVTALFASGCDLFIKTYNGKKIVKIEYKTIDYFGGATRTYVFDFIEKNVHMVYWSPSYSDQTEKNEWVERVEEPFAEFTQEQIDTFMNKCYTYGLFSLKKEYFTNDIICDGGAWRLIIEYEDGKTKTSEGDNAYPERVFEKCKYAFYDLCGQGVVGFIEH